MSVQLTKPASMEARAKWKQPINFGNCYLSQCGEDTREQDTCKPWNIPTINTRPDQGLNPSPVGVQATKCCNCTATKVDHRNSSEFIYFFNSRGFAMMHFSQKMTGFAATVAFVKFWFKLVTSEYHTFLYRLFWTKKRSLVSNLCIKDLLWISYLCFFDFGLC